MLSRRQKGSANRARAQHRIAVLHRKVRETRLDHAHKTALRLVRENQAVYAEDLAVSGLMRTRLARSVSDAGWSQLMRCVEEKAAKPLHVREWACAACGTVHDRDLNAAKNILALEGRERLNACGVGVRPRLVAVGAEAGTHQSAA